MENIFSASSARRISYDHDPYIADDPRGWPYYGTWPANWISVAEPPTKGVVAYKLNFSLEEAGTFTIHVTADEQYQLFLDGVRVGRGPERGDPNIWHFESYEVSAEAGEHCLVARVWSVGQNAPFAQMTIEHGFLLSPENEKLIALLATGVAPWQGKHLHGYSFVHAMSAETAGDNLYFDGREFEWGFETGAGEGWEETVHGAPGVCLGQFPAFRTYHPMTPASLPPMVDEARTGFGVRHVSATSMPTSEKPVLAADSIAGEVESWQSLMSAGQALTVPAHTARRVIVDLENYYCGWPEVVTSGGANSHVRIQWSEGLYESLQTWQKGHRDEIEGKYFAIFAYGNSGYDHDGPGDEFITDGGERRVFSPLWWQAGRWVEICVQTADEPLTIESFVLHETRYPLENEGQFRCGDEKIERIIPIMTRAMQMCSHETYMDCPFYEQQMYPGDTRLEILATYVMTADDRLPRKALTLFDSSRMPNGLTYSNYPSTWRQVISPFSLWWVAMAHDYALWRGDAAFIRSLLPGIHAVTDYFAGLINDDGLMIPPTGWNFMDWVNVTALDAVYPEPNKPGQWPHGIPPEGEHGISGLMNWHLAMVFRMAGELDEWFGVPEMAALQTRRAKELAAATDRFFWNEERGLYADDLAQKNWSEHSQCLALLSELMPEEKKARLGEGLLNAPDLARTTIYFSYYLFEAYRLLGRPEALLKRFEDWQVHYENDLKTTVEQPEPTRSDCHAWGAHPLFHFYATLAGIRPAGPGFTKVSINPQLGPLREIDAVLPHPLGEIHVRVKGENVEVKLPEGVTQVSAT